MRLKPIDYLLAIILILTAAVLFLMWQGPSYSQPCTDGSPMSALAGKSSCGVWPTLGMVSKARVTTDTSGLYAWTYPAACVNGGNIPEITAVAEGPTPQGGVNVNVQIEGVPTSTAASFRVTKTTSTVVALLGLTISVASTGTGIGATVLDLSCSPQ